MKIDKTLLKVLRVEIDEALAALGTKHGLVFHAGSATYQPDGTCATYKLELAVVGDDGVVATKEAAAFRDLAGVFYGLKSEDLGRTFVSNGKTFKLTGMSAGRVKMPIQGMDVETGKTYKFAVELIKRKFAEQDTTTKT
jgi:hypothetical protein